MDKQVFVIMRDGSQVGMRVEFELKFLHGIHQVKLFTPKFSPEIFRDFLNEFKINVFPVVQVEEKGGFITIHMDPNHEEPSQGAGGRQISRFTYLKLNNVEDLIEKSLEIYQR